MTIEEPGKPENNDSAKADAAVIARKRSRAAWTIGGASVAGLLLVGAVAGAVGMKFGQMNERQALLPPVAINSMADDSLVAVKGKAVEFFGNKFIITDGSGRALVDTGREGEDRQLAANDEQVTVQGRFGNGFIRAAMVIHEDGRVDELRPARPPHDHGPGKDHGPRRGPQDDRGPAGQDPATPPPPRP